MGGLTKRRPLSAADETAAPISAACNPLPIPHHPQKKLKSGRKKEKRSNPTQQNNQKWRTERLGKSGAEIILARDNFSVFRVHTKKFGGKMDQCT